MRLFSRRKLQDGEVQALYDRHGPALLLYARSLLGNKSAAEDALQQVFMKLLEQNSIPQDPRPYLFRAVHNTALNLMRRDKSDVELSEIEPWFESPQPSPTEQISLQCALMKLPDDQRQTLVLHIWGGLAFAEIGELLSVSSNTAASRYRYAIQKLRTTLEPEEIPHTEE